jgi:Neuraminidase (sialidase)
MLLFAAALLALHLQPVSPSAPNRQPQLASGNGQVALVFGSGDSIWFSGSGDNGRTWTRPTKVAELPKLLLGRHRGPRVVISGNAIIVSAIASEPGDLLAWRSTDGGRSWSSPITVNDHPKAAREGLHAMAGDAEGHLAATWLDDRTPNGKRLYGAFSNDAGATWSRNAVLYQSPGGTICQCCAPSLAALGRGEFAAMWRNAVDGSRDMYTLRLRDGKAAGSAEKAGVGTWKLDACPMDGGGIAIQNGGVATAWRRDHDVYIAEPGKPEVKVGTGQDVAFGANRQGFYALWSTAAGIEMHAPNAAGPTRLSDVGGFPAVVTLPDGGMLAAWEENGTIATARF